MNTGIIDYDLVLNFDLEKYISYYVNEKNKGLKTKYYTAPQSELKDIQTLNRQSFSASFIDRLHGLLYADDKGLFIEMMLFEVVKDVSFYAESVQRFDLPTKPQTTSGHFLEVGGREPLKEILILFNEIKEVFRLREYYTGKKQAPQKLKLPEKLLLLDKLGMLDLEYFRTVPKAKRNRILAQLLDADERNIKGNLAVIEQPTSDQAKKYNPLRNNNKIENILYS